MKTNVKILLLFALLMLISQACTKEEEPVSGDDQIGDNNNNGGDDDNSNNDSNNRTATFFVTEDFNCGYIEVFLEGEGSGTISRYHGGSSVNCGDEGTATFSGLSPDTYYFTAECSDYSWEGSFSFGPEPCYIIELKADGSSDGGGNDDGGGDDGGGDDGGGDNDGGGDDNDSMGDLIFYTLEDFGCGNITVQLAGNGSETMTSYFSSTPSCGASGGANFYDLEYASYEFYAECQDGTYWQGSITIDTDCSQMQLTL